MKEITKKKDEITSGGKFVEENNDGGEVCNFLKCDDGKVYGYVRVKSSVKIEKLGASSDDEFVENIDVIWIATKKNAGRHVIGWYKDATVFKNPQTFEKPPSPQHKRDELETYQITAKAENVYLIPTGERNIKIPTGERNIKVKSASKVKGFIGTNPFWFASNKLHIPEVNEFIKLVKSTMSTMNYVHGYDEAELELSAIESSKTLTNTEKKALIMARRRQGQFRESLIEKWRGCAVFKCNNYVLLRASHIKPWKPSDNVERLDPDNGLLLFAGLDAAFDKGLISFNKAGKILISSKLSKQDKDVLGISEKTRLKIKPNNKQITYLKYHNSKEFKT